MAADGREGQQADEDRVLEDDTLDDEGLAGGASGKLDDGSEVPTSTGRRSITARVSRPSRRGYRRSWSGTRTPRRSDSEPPAAFGSGSSPPSSSNEVVRATPTTVRTVGALEDTVSDELPRAGFAPADELPRTLRQPTASDGSSPSAAIRVEPDGDPEILSSERGTKETVDPLVGLVIADRYRIVECIGRGGMGIVYRVEHTSIGKLLAMKLLAGELSASDEVMRRFRQEALTVSKLSSPHTVQVFDYGRWQHLTYLVMELVHGKELSRILRERGPIPFAVLGPWLVQVCASLREAHEKGITHRDVKPENIMIIQAADGSARAKVLDFGLAKLREGQELNDVTQQGAVVGTPYYMAPEQVLGEEVDGRTDIYSLGAVMYRVLTGFFPFNARTPMAMFTKHLTEPVRPIGERFPDLSIPKRVCNAVERCLAKGPEDRFQHIDELRDVIEAELSRVKVAQGDGESSTEMESQRPPSEEAGASSLVVSQVATREELEAYEAGLRRNRFGTHILLATLLAALIAGGVFAKVRFKNGQQGRELEPNNVAAAANVLPLGQEVRGRVGARMGHEAGDRDFFRFEVAKDQSVRVLLDGLPNFPICIMLYRVGYSDHIARYCTGVAGQRLDVASLRLDKGSYFAAVMQDYVPGRRKKKPLIYENVSDDYVLYIGSAKDGASEEDEPNDTLTAPTVLRVGQVFRGALGWQGDVDFVCAQPGSGPVKWRVEDKQRPPGTVLEVTPIEAGQEQPLVRVHPAKAQPYQRARLEADVNAPWLSPKKTSGSSCLRLRLVLDPWQDAKDVWPTPSPYLVELRGAR